MRFDDETPISVVERDQLASDAERDRLRGRQLRLAIAELDARDVVAVRSGGDRGGELRRVDVAARPRRDDVHEIAGDRELRVVCALDPVPESRAHDARERLEVEADREPVGMGTDLQRTGELRRQQGAASCTVVVDRDRTREQQTHRRSRTARSWIEDRGRDVCERRVDDPAVPREQTQQRSPVELEAVAGGCRDDVGPVQCHGRRGGLLPRLCKRLQHAGRPAGDPVGRAG